MLHKQQIYIVKKMIISKDCYWIFDNNQNTIKAMCVECYSSKKEKGGSFWRGSIKGYGEYNLNCISCGKNINKLKDVNDKADFQI